MLSGLIRRWETPYGIVNVLFSTRMGGSSQGEYASANLGLHIGDNTAHVMMNRVAVCDFAETVPELVYSVNQVHGNNVYVAHPDSLEEASWGMQPPTVEADAIVFAEGAAAIMVADCIPAVLIGDKASAVVHLGWRGIASDLVQKATAEIGAPIAVALGPHIGACCYEVGIDVAQQFSAHAMRSADGKMYLDLEYDLLKQLSDIGFHELASGGICTSCHHDRYFSYRANGSTTGRQCVLSWVEVAS